MRPCFDEEKDILGMRKEWSRVVCNQLDEYMNNKCPNKTSEEVRQIISRFNSSNVVFKIKEVIPNNKGVRDDYGIYNDRFKMEENKMTIDVFIKRERYIVCSWKCRINDIVLINDGTPYIEFIVNGKPVYRYLTHNYYLFSCEEDVKTPVHMLLHKCFEKVTNRYGYSKIRDNEFNGFVYDVILRLFDLDSVKELISRG